MYLKELEVFGFKSFANKSKLQFNSSISAIVGPNGSGKSNIAEAFRFVLGEQSFKSMRGKKGEDLIFNGTSTISKQSRASVKVVFDNSDKKLPIDFEEVIIERIVYRDGINEYKINGSIVRLRDIIELLAVANIGSSGHHIISQGEADRILNTTPKERKSILEEALGLKIFEYKKKESQKKLEKTQENILQVQSLRREIAPHLKFLKKQVEKIEESKKIKIKLVDFYKEYFKREFVYLKNKKQELAHAIDLPKKRLLEIEKQISDYREISERGEKTELKENIKKMQADLFEIGERKTDLTRRQGQIEGELKSLERILGINSIQQQKQIFIEQKELDELGDSLLIMDKNLQDYKDIDLIKQKIKEFVSTISNFIERHKSKKDEKDAKIISEISEVKINLSKILVEIGNTQKQENELKQKMSDLRQNLEKDKTDSLVAEKNIILLMTEQNELQQKISEYSIEVYNFNQDESNLKQEMMEAVTLVGRDSVNYEQVNISEKEIINEDRQKQSQRRKELEKLKLKVEEMGGNSGDEILREYQESAERDLFLEREINDLEKSAESLNQLIIDLEGKINQKFHEGIIKINKEFQRFFELMFGGGDASIEIIKIKNRRRDTDLDFGQGDEYEQDEEDDIETEEGIDVKVNLPRKKVKGLMMLSGGERALTSIALIFAMSQVNPPPFIILDETDAALDEANSRKYGDMIENLSKHSQLILITHNRETMRRAGVIYGVTMASGISKLLSINFEEGISWAK